MSVDDYGIEVLKKTAEYVSGTSKADYYIKVGLSSNDGAKLGYDSLTNTLNVISYEHHEIHSGRSFSYHHFGSLNTGGEINITFKTPTGTRLPHVIDMVDSTAAAEFMLEEAPTVTAGTGTNVTPVQKNRSSSNTSVLFNVDSTPAQNSITTNATIIASGVMLINDSIGQGQQEGGENRAINEFVLKADTIYSYRVISAANSNKVRIRLEWYEHDGG